MVISDVVLKARNQESFSNLLPVSSVKTESDKALAAEQGYMAEYTAAELKAIVPDIDIGNLYYACGFTPIYYWDGDKVVFPCSILLVPPSGTDVNQSILHAISSVKQRIADGDYMFIATALSDRMRMEYLQRLIQNGVPNAYELFSVMYPISDFGCSVLGKETLLKLKAMKPAKMVQATKRALAALPDTLTVYRGVGDASAELPEAYSWTLNPAVAIFFATRFTSSNARVYQAQVEKAAVIEYFEENEAEVVVLPDDVKAVTEYPLYGLDWLASAVEDGATEQFWLYQKTADYDAVPFRQNSDIHGRAHCGRVLFLCLLLAYMKGLDEEDTEILVDAALYHDTGRTSDDADLFHGELSAKALKEAYPDTDPITLFLMKYHCRPDVDGYAYIEKNWESQGEKARVKMLFDIFKDADGLDRFRLGNFALDMFQLRTDEARKLPQIAKLVEEQLKI